MNLSVPDFSGENLHRQLDRLLAAFESRGMHVSQSLLPGLTRAELDMKCGWFPGELVDEIVSLYGWRGGQGKDAWETEYPFWFRDNSFCSIERAEHEYKSMMETYGAYPPDHDMLKYSFPVASFNGGWYVIPTKSHYFNPLLKRPVISVHEGVDVYYYSIELMVETCVDWVENENYTADGLYPEELEMRIWRKHNPGIFL